MTQVCYNNKKSKKAVLALLFYKDKEDADMTELEIEQLLNHILKDLFYKILRLQAKSVSKSTNNNINRTEMHVLENIQDTPDATVTDIAETLGISKATASVSIARLQEKDYLKKIKSEKDKRKSILVLTENGEFCCKKHKQFHDTMVRSVLKEFKIEEYPEVIKSLQALADYFNKLKK